MLCGVVRRVSKQSVLTRQKGEKRGKRESILRILKVSYRIWFGT